MSNRPYLELETPARRRCHTTLIVKQGAQGFPVYYRAHSGYLHVDFKARTQKRATRKMEAFLQLQSVGKLTTWGYGVIRWIIHTSYDNQEVAPSRPPRFHILKGLPPTLIPRERQLVMAALLHDLVDTPYHPSKLGRAITILDPYVRWLCEHHHAAKEHPTNQDLQLLQEADSRTSRYARLLSLPTPPRKMAPVNTRPLTNQLEQAAQCSVYQLYSVIYQSEDLKQFTASKTHPTETLRQHLLNIANWVLFFLRTSPSFFLAISVALVGIKILNRSRDFRSHFHIHIVERPVKNPHCLEHSLRKWVRSV